MQLQVEVALKGVLVVQAGGLGYRCVKSGSTTSGAMSDGG
jgi:hypothetical protein